MKLNILRNKDKEHFSGELMLSEINKFQETIKTRMSKIEPVFLKLGQDMQQIYSYSEQLTQIITDSADTIGSQAEDSLNSHIERIVNDLLKELDDCRETITANIDHMESSTIELEKLCHVCTELNKISRFLNIVGMNIDIESCRSAESKIVFEGFGEEVKELAHKIGKIAGQIYDDSKSVQSSQMSGVASVRSSLEKLSLLSDSAQKGVLHAMDKVEKLTQLSHSTLQSAASHSQQIQKQVGDIVMALQFHDIVRQKLEHVISAFEDCRNLSAKTDYQEIVSDIREAKQKNDMSKGQQKNYAQIYFILKVQAAQLNQIISELNNVHTSLGKAFNGINDTTSRLMDDVVGSGMDKKEEKELEKEFESIKNELENLKTLRSHGQDMSTKMMESIKKTSLIISGLSQYTGQVGNININLQYKALNAIIMTSKLGIKGRTLEVLAREVRLISLDSNEQMEQIVKALKAVTDITGNLRELKENTPGQAAGLLSISLDNTVNRISDTMRRYQENRSQSVEMAQQLGKSIQDTRKGVVFISQWAEDISSVNTQINQVLGQMESLILSLDKAILTEVENIAKRYTMESERVIHIQASSGGKDHLKEHGARNEPDSHSQTDKDDEFDDNIELF